ncbi:MAG: hypothetical protein JWM31_203 [Solirubrobacterales bacterium]|jgi:hypothetical protein|nr:hypothetical protein [Solirubrobacterales bacterium]
MPEHHPQYEYKSVRALRGTETKTIAKWQKDGWEVDTKDQGAILRTEITLRRVKPKTFGVSVLALFRRLEPTAQRGLLAVSGGLVLIAVVVAVVFSVRGGDGGSEPTASAAEASVEPSAEPTAKQESAATDSASVPTQSPADVPLTVQNNEDFAALLGITDPSVAAVGEFAAEYQGRTIAFDGNVAYMNHHGDYTTRYDILINAGNYSESSSAGPNFQFRDVNTTSDLRLTGSNVPDTIGTGDNLRIVARVVDYNSTQQLLFLEPISTEVR